MLFPSPSFVVSGYWASIRLLMYKLLLLLFVNTYELVISILSFLFSVSLDPYNRRMAAYNELSTSCNVGKRWLLTVGSSGIYWLRNAGYYKSTNIDSLLSSEVISCLLILSWRLPFALVIISTIDCVVLSKDLVGAVNGYPSFYYYAMQLGIISSCNASLATRIIKKFFIFYIWINIK